jgi:imidazole glycerol-phosphate synthase subunit HisF
VSSSENQEPKSSMFYGASPIIFELAKKLRNNVTAAEMILWGRLKEYFPQLKFRRQHPVSIYIADFYCHSEKLIIELDGSIHNLADVKNNDQIRQTDLENLGIKVLRFSNEYILYHLEATLERIGNNIK